jgi:NTP pyrophosphatase (non-canonical NTP hydrolase)
MDDKDKPKDMRSYIAHELYELAEDEAEANKGYFKFLSKFKPNLTSKQVEQIESIIADEMIHYNMLIAMVTEFTKVKPTEM